jgi:hypothetical protein
MIRPVVLFAAACAAGLSLGHAPARADSYSVGITDERGPNGVTTVRHSYRCGTCTVVRRYRAGEWTYVVPQPPRVDYGQALPIYQPPIHAHPRHVVPVYPLRPRSGAYPVQGAPGVAAPQYITPHRAPMMAQRPYYPTGSDARVITLDDPRPPRRERRRR